MARLVNSFLAFFTAAVLIVAIAPPCEATISCNIVASYANQCVPYLTGSGALAGCCGGVKSLFSAANTTPDRQSVCRCLKSLASQVSDINDNVAAKLLSACGINIVTTISVSTDCSTVE